MEWRFKNENKVIEIGKNFCVAPPWYKTDKIKITLTSGKSFGTGIHETTASCIEIMETLDLRGKSVLDIGIGSGILSIVASKLDANRIIGFDIEKFAIEECIKNATLNNAENIECFVSNTPKSVKGQFDIVIANIFEDIIISMKDDITRLTKKGGYALFSGVIIEENFTVQRVFGNMGFRLLKNVFLDDYTTLLFQKGD